MTSTTQTLDASDTVQDAARLMADNDIGDVIVTEDGAVCGIVTDRDITVRAVADGRSPAATRLGDVCSRQLATLAADSSVDDAVRLMRDKAVRRVPIVESGRPVGIATIGDLAVEQDRRSALADISSAPANT